MLFLYCLPVAAHPPLTSGGGQAAVRYNQTRVLGLLKMVVALLHVKGV